MVLFGTSDTYNILAEKFPGQYKNVVCPRAISKIDQEFYRQLDTFIPEQEKVGNADFIDGLAVAVEMLDLHCGKNKYRKRVFLITDGENKTKTSEAEI